jgi:hypothetical protein
MRSRRQRSFRPCTIVPVLTLAASAAWAQPAPKVQLSSYELLIAVTPGTATRDVNAAPECLSLSLPCSSSGSLTKIGSIGMAVSLSRYLPKPADASKSGALAITAELSRFSNAYDSRDATGAIRRERMRTTSVLVGPRFTTPFLRENKGSTKAGRYFLHALAGSQTSDLAGRQSAVVVGGGGEIAFPRGSTRNDSSGPPRAFTFRVGLDYWINPGSPSGPGFRLVVGILIGPRLTGS